MKGKLALKTAVVLRCIRCGMLVLFQLTASCLVRAQAIKTEAVTAPAATAATIPTELENYIEQARADWQVPGLAVAIVDEDRPLWSRGFGSKRAGTDDLVDEHTLFAIASNTKAFTAAALAILVEDGKLRWDDRVDQHLPWFELYDPFVSHEMRIRDLLCHRSGLGTFSGDLLWYGTSYSPEELLKRARHLRPEGPFRAHYGYSNLMFLAAGEVVAAVSGQPWEQFVQRRILEPLQMHRTCISVRDLVAMDNFATPHKTLLDGSKPIPWVNWDSMAAAGGLISSVHDMSHWLRLQLRGGMIREDQRLFSEALAREMWQVHTPIPISDRSLTKFPSTHFRGYGLGWALSDYKGRKLVAHGGGYDGMYSMVLIIPEERWGIVVLTNSMTSISESIVYRAVDERLGGDRRDWSRENLEAFRKSRQEFRDRIDTAIKPAAVGTRPSHAWDAYQATFHDDLYGDVSVTQEEGGLVLRLLPNPQFVADLEHLHYDTFLVRWRHESAWFDEGTAHFVADARGRFVELKLDIPNDDLWFHELRLIRQ